MLHLHSLHHQNTGHLIDGTPVENPRHPDRLIVCVHHPLSAADAGMDLYESLKENQVAWDDLEKRLLWVSTACSEGRSKTCKASAGPVGHRFFL